MRTTSHPARHRTRTRTGPGTRPPVRLPAALLLAACLALAGCGAGSGDSGSDAADGKAAVPEAQRQGAAGVGTAGSGGADASGSRKGTPGGTAKGAPKPAASSIVRTASLTVRVADVPEALDTARTVARDAGGFVGDEDTRRNEDGSRHSRVVLRVPAAKYDEVLRELQGTGRLLSRTAKAEDVTDQVVDVDSRVKSQRASVARIRALMDRATKLSDVVSLEGELSTREADLEALLAQRAALKDRVDLATVTLSLTESAAADKGNAATDDDPGFLDALSGGWDVFLTLLRWLALAVGAVLPFAAALALGALLWRRVLRPRLPRHPVPAAATARVPAPAPAPASTPDATAPSAPPSAPPVRSDDD
jgi:hypothetical protein